MQGDLKQIMRRYQHYVCMDQGAEARWALGRWLVSQWAAGAQDSLEDVIRTRAQDSHHFPLRRAPPDDELRADLQRWTSELTELIADVGVAAARLACPGALRDLPQSATASDFRSYPRQRHGRIALVAGRDKQMMRTQSREI